MFLPGFEARIIHTSTSSL